MVIALATSGAAMRSASSGRDGPSNTAMPEGPSQSTSLSDGDDDDPRPWRYRPDPLGEIEPGDLLLKQGIDHHHIGLLGGDARHRGVRVLFRADELGFLLAREHLLQVLRDLRQVLDEQDSFHAARVYVAARPRAMFEAAAPMSASPMNDTPTPAVMPCQYHSGYRRNRLLVAGSKRKFPCGKKISWKRRNSGSNASAAAMPTIRTIPAAARLASRTSIVALRCPRARVRRKATMPRARTATVSAPRKTERTSAMCAYSSEVKIGPVPYAIGGFAAAPITYDAHA